MEADLLRRSRIDLPFAAVPSAALRGRAPWTMARNLLVMSRGSRQAGRILDQFRPQVVLATGGYVSVPVGWAAWRRHIPLLLFLPDVVPGLAVRLLAQLAARVATSTPDSARYLPRGKMVVSGYPVRQALLKADREESRTHFGFSDQDTVLLVYGGSRGARSINRALAAALPALLERAAIIHICGREGDEHWLRRQAAELAPELQQRYRLHPYLHQEMPLAFAAADVALCRAGASVLGELPARGLPALLVPYPYVHQEENADYLVREGAAVKVLDRHLQGADGQPNVAPLIQALTPLLEDPNQRQRMAAASRRLARPEAAATLVAQLCSLAKNQGGRKNG